MHGDIQRQEQRSLQNRAVMSVAKYFIVTSIFMYKSFSSFSSSCVVTAQVPVTLVLACGIVDPGLGSDLTLVIVHYSLV